MASLGRVYEGYMQGPKRSAWQMFWGFFWATFKWIALGGSLVLIVLLLFGGLRAQQTGVLQTEFTKVGDSLSKVPFVSAIVDMFRVIKDPSRFGRAYAFKGEVDDNENNRELGLTFSNTKLSQERYLQKQKISISATVKAQSFKEDSLIRFFCKDTTSNIDGMVRPTEPVLLEKNIPRVFTVGCDINTENIKLEGQEQTRAERILLSAVYNFKTASYIPIYTISDEKLNTLQRQTINPFVKEGINDPLLDENTGVATSRYNYGPMKVLVNSQISQPFTEKGAIPGDPYYDLTIVIEGSNLGPIYQGRLSKLDNVYLYLPNNLELAGDELTNNFDIVEQSSDEDTIFVKYKLKQEKINDLNDQCKNYGYNTAECDSLWQRGFGIVTAKFKISSLDKQDLDQKFIRAEVDYDFEAQTSTVVTILKSFEVA